MTKRNYKHDDRQTLRILKMQQDDLNRLASQTVANQQSLSQMNQHLNELKQRAQATAEAEGVELPEERHMPAAPKSPREKMRLDIVPTWEELEQRAKQEGVSSRVGVEDLLTQEEIARSEAEVKRINDEFARRTGLSVNDLAFLAIATSIQTARWAMTPRLLNKAGKTGKVLAALSPSAMALIEAKPKSDKEVAIVNEANREFQEEAGWQIEERRDRHRTWEDILETKDHLPQKVFSNDAMNWIFRLVNTITYTHTDNHFNSVDKNGKTIHTPTVFADAFRSIREDPRRLSAAVYAMYVQDKLARGERVDMLQPFTEAIAPLTDSPLYQSQMQQLVSIRDVTLVGQQAAIPLIINMAVGLMHSFMYNPATDGQQSFYEARTRKILMLSNIMASGINLAFTIGTRNLAKLDIGGLLVTGTRAMMDLSYLTDLEDEFVKHHLDKALEQELQDIDSYFLNLPAVVE